MPTCFVIMPITTPKSTDETYRDPDHFAHVLEYLFFPALTGAGYEVWPPAASGSDLIQGEIIRQLDTADLVLCDMTSLNANVFFELGIRTALDKPVAMVKDGHTEKVPFDVGSMNCHQYDGRLEAWTLPAEVEKLKAHVQACISRERSRNTLWKYFGIEAQARVGSAGTTEDDKFDYLVRQVEELRGAIGRPPHAPRSDRTLVGTFTSVSGNRRNLEALTELDTETLALLTEAARAAGHVFAPFTAYVDEDRSITLDFDGFSIGPSQAKAIVSAAERSGITLKVARIADDDTTSYFQSAGVEPVPEPQGKVIAEFRSKPE